MKREVALRNGCHPGEHIQIRCYYCPAVGLLRWRMLTRLVDGEEVSIRPSVEVSTTLEWEHYVPLWRGGRNDASNVVLACLRCNQSKGWYRTGAEFVALIAAMPPRVFDDPVARSRYLRSQPVGRSA